MSQINFPGRFTDDHIKQIEDRRNQLVAEGKIGKSQEIAYNKSIPKKQEFLQEFARTLSLSVARKKADVSIAQWKRWKKDHQFLREYNNVLEAQYEDLMPSILSRAKGYVKEDLETESGYAEDAEGTIIRFNADSSLAVKLMDRLAPLDEKQGSGGVVVEINVGALLGKTNIAVAPVAGDQESSAVRVSDDSVVAHVDKEQ